MGFNPTDRAVIADPIAPQPSKRGSQGFAKHAGISSRSNSVIIKIENGLLRLPIKPFQIFQHAPIEAKFMPHFLTRQTRGRRF